MRKIALLAVLLPSMALAEGPQAQDPAYLAKVIDVLQAQRNAASDAAAMQQTQALVLQDQVTQLKKELDATRGKLNESVQKECAPPH